MILLTAEQSKQADALAAARGIAGASLMEKAGASAAAIAMRAWDKRPVAVLCGPGNNGGDGFVIARHFKEAGWTVRLALLGPRDALKGDAALMAGLYDGEIETFGPAVLEGAGLIIDAIFGVGLARPVESETRAMIEAANAHPAPVFAVDIPSGVDADSGRILGAAMQAARTVTFFTRKPGHMLFPGRALAGAVDVIDIGIPPDVLTEIAPKTVENQPGVWGPQFRRPNFATHKYARGHAAVVSGGRLKTGAARLAARSALRAGAGLVTMLTPADAAAENAAHLTSVMLREIAGAADVTAALADKRFTAALIGPGAGVSAATAEVVKAILASSAGAVLDADALTSFEAAPERLFSLLRPDDVLTPHVGEFSRLFKEVDGDSSGRLEAARQAAAKAGAVVILKGADTVIAAPDGRAAINANAPADLATAGSGDVLAGIVAGLRAQGMSGFEAACAGVWLHGGCGQAAGPGLIAEDLPDALPIVLKSLLSPPQQAPQPRDHEQ